jgi:flagellar hook assembly protein FlgD
MIHAAIIGVLFASFSLAATSICATYSTDQHWTVPGSPYNVTCSTTVKAGKTLIIDPGVTVTFASTADLNISGKLTAIGTAANVITFKSSAATPTPGSWRAIRFQSTSGSTSQLSNANLSYGGSTTYGAIIYIIGSSPTIDHVAVTNSATRGIRITGGAATPSISYATVSNNATYGIDLESSAGMNLSNSGILNNTNYAIGAEPATRLNGLTGLTITGNGSGATKDGIGYRSGSISTAESWHSGATWFLTGSPTVAAAGSLNIDSGVTVKSAGSYEIDVHGKLTAIGTSGSPITFTSGNATPAAGNWKGIHFESDSNPSSQISYATISYGGTTNSSNIYIVGSSPTIDNVTVNYSSTNGILVSGATANPTITNCTVSNNGSSSYYGINVDQSSGVNLSNCTFSNNVGYAIGAEAGTRLNGLTGLILTGNGSGAKDGIGYRGGSISVVESWHAGATWFLTGTPTVAAAGSLTIDPAVTVKTNSGLEVDVHGKLTAIGTTASPITFTSNAVTPTPGSWRAIHFESDSNPTSRIAYATVSYAGSTTYDGAIYVEGASPTIDHTAVTYSASAGIIVSGTTAAPFIRNCAFANNATGMKNSTPANIIPATLNYWGATDGPSGSGPGTGQSISTGLTFEPWLTAVPTDPQFVTSASFSNRTFNPTIGLNLGLSITTSLSGSWTVKYYNDTNTLVRTISGSGPSASVQWDGKSDGGVLQSNGAYSYLIESTASGNPPASPAKGYATLDASLPLAIGGFSVTPLYFSPNGDAVQDTTILSATINFGTVSWTINVRNSSNAIINSTTGQGASVLFVWNGADLSAIVQPDGPYTLELLVTGGTASAGASQSVILDNTFPTASILSPTQNVVLSNVYQTGATDVPVVGTASDAYLTSWKLERGTGAAPSSWTTMASGTTSVTSALLQTWATASQANGQYTVRLSGWDQAGNLSRDSRLVSIGNFSASQNVTQINAGSDQTVTYTSIVPFPLTQTLVLKNEAGQIVRTLVNGANRAAGTYPDGWNGKSDSNGYLPDGGYFYTASVSDGVNTMSWDLSNQFLTNDSATDPNIPANDSFNNQPMIVTYNFAQPGRVMVTIAPGDWGIGDSIALTCDAPQFCIVQNEYQESGPHTIRWAGVDNDGNLLPFMGTVGIASFRTTFPKNAVVVFGTKPTISPLIMGSPTFTPGSGNNSATFDVTSFQNQSVNLKLEFTNLESHSILRTMNLANQAPGHLLMQWDGRGDNGMLVASGFYSVTAQVSDSIGNKVKEQILTTVRY